MIVEVRSTGTHTVFPPSTHEIGEPIAWDDEQQEPAEVDPELLLASTQRLAEAVLIELGEKRPPRERQKRPAARPHTPNRMLPERASPEDRAARCLAAMLRIRIADQRDGSRRLFAATCRSVEHDLDDAPAVALIREYARKRPFPRDWSDAEIVQRLRDAEPHCRRAQALELAEDGCIPLGNREPQSGKLVLSPTRTLPTAESFVRDYVHSGYRFRDFGHEENPSSPANSTRAGCASVIVTTTVASPAETWIDRRSNVCWPTSRLARSTA